MKLIAKSWNNNLQKLKEVISELGEILKLPENQKLMNGSKRSSPN